MGQVRKDILNGWKEIANYVGRDPRTVERWEKQRGLPVHRVPGAGRANVYAHVLELDQWFAGGRRDNGEATETKLPQPEDVQVTTDTAVVSPTDAISTENTATDSDALPFASTTTSVAIPVATASLPSREIFWITAAALTLVCVLGGWLILRRTHRVPVATAAAVTNKASGKYSFNASSSTPGVPYPSRVPGVDDLYLHGVYSFEQRTADSLKKSEEYFEAATARDPNFAPAYAGLADTFNLMREYSVMTDAEAYPKAKLAAERAVALDPNLPHAHSSLGFIDYFWLADPPASEREFKRALELDPSQAQAHHWYGSVLTHEGRFAEAVEQLNMAQRLQPTSEAILCSRALALGLGGHRAEAVESLQELTVTAPNSVSPHRMLAILAADEPRDTPRWLLEWYRVAEMRHDTEQLEIMRAAERGYRSGGEKAMWIAFRREQERLHPPPQPKPYAVAAAYARLGDPDGAFAVLAPLVLRRDPLIMGIAMDPALKPLHRDPRFATLLVEARIPPAVLNQ